MLESAAIWTPVMLYLRFFIVLPGGLMPVAGATAKLPTQWNPITWSAATQQMAMQPFTTFF